MSAAAGVASVLFLLVSFGGESELVVDVSDARDDPERESVLYQPEPLKTIPAGWKIRRIFAPHAGQVVRGVSENF